MTLVVHTPHTKKNSDAVLDMLEGVSKTVLCTQEDLVMVLPMHVINYVMTHELSSLPTNEFRFNQVIDLVFAGR